ncbi:hypothetical protein [Polymorphospora rubra]|uniref:hypothetical protein n=1 Tax=Polymorphospora rubra TaxID=338584 RepID=UPI0033E32D24
MEIPEAELRRLVDIAVEDDPTELLEVARVRPDLVAPFHRRLAEAQVWWPADLYHGMSEETAAELVRRLDDGAGPVGLVHVLAAGATETAVAAVGRWTAEPPQWAAELPIPLGLVGHAGGWELDPSGRRRALASRYATELVPVAAGRAPGAGPVSGGPLDDTCGWCGLRLWRLLEVDRALLPDLFGGDSGQITVATCIRCGCYTTLFTDAGRFAAENYRPEFLGRDDDGWELPEDGVLGLGEPRPTPFAASAWNTGGSTVGGMPEWIQDAEYPACPRCRRTMPFVGMVTGGDLWGELGEGCHYLFHDPTCGLSAAVYQQS